MLGHWDALRVDTHIYQNVVFLLCLLLLSCGKEPNVPETDKRVIVLGVDGMDPSFVERHWESLPNLDALRQQGEFKSLATTIPPQSPVAAGQSPAGGARQAAGSCRQPSPELPDQQS